MDFPRIGYRQNIIVENNPMTDIVEAYDCVVRINGIDEVIGVLARHVSGVWSFIEYISEPQQETFFKSVKKAKYHIRCVKEDYCMAEDYYAEHGIPRTTQRVNNYE